MESASPSIKVTLTLMGNVRKTGVNVMDLQAEKGNAMAILRDKNVWICDTGASTHVTRSSKRARNVRETQTYSLGHTDEAVESTAIIDILGVLLKALLNECSYNKEHNFNLLSMSRLLHKQGWKMSQGDESLIRIENGKGGVINFDIVVPTAKGAIYACKFMQEAEVVSACTDTGA
jgi:hypothetical protein